MLLVKTRSKEETAGTGYRLGKLLSKGDIVCLTGGLGSGKTSFTGGIAAALGISGYVTSPTFTIVNEYYGVVPLYHFDVYRITSNEEMSEIGFDEYIEGRGIIVIEWAELIEEILPQERIIVDIKALNRNAAPDGTETKVSEEQDSENTRLISIHFIGKRYYDYEERFNNYSCEEQSSSCGYEERTDNCGYEERSNKGGIT